MASTSSTVSNLSSIFPLRFSSLPNRSLPFPFQFSLTLSDPPRNAGPLLRAAAKPDAGPLNKKRKKRTKPKSEASTVSRRSSDIDSMDDEDGDDVDDDFLSMPLPKPPAGFVFDDEGRVRLASKKRIIPVVDPESNKPLDCVVRRVFKSSKGDDCLLVCPVDLPISLLKSTNFEGWTLIGDEEIEPLIPTAAYTLAKTHMHLVDSGFFHTARGGFAHNEDDAFSYTLDNGVATEALEIVCFYKDGAHYMIYTPLDPIIFVVIKDEKGVYRRADDVLGDDPAVLSATDEEIEFSAMAQAEEDAMAELLNGGGM